MSAISKRIRRSAGEKLKQMRKERNLYRDQMAAHLGLSPSGYYKNEMGQSLPALPTLSRMVTEFDISMDWFLFDKGPRHFKEKAKLEHLVEEHKKTKQDLKDTQNERDNAVPAFKASLKPGVTDLLEYIDENTMFYHSVMMYFQQYKNKEENPENQTPG